MQTQQTAEEAAPILIRLLESIVSNPRALELEAREKHSLVNWLVKVDINDAGIVVGKKGAHINAFVCLVQAMGKTRGQDWRFALVEPESGERDRAPRPEREAPLAHDYSHDLETLKETLACLLSEPSDVTVTQSARVDFVFTVKPSRIQDYERLVTPLWVTKREAVTPIAALGTLFRAVGMKAGVNYSVATPGL